METNEDNDLEARRIAARERRNAAEAKRNALAEAAAKRLEVEAEERDAADEEAIALAEEAHGPKRIAVVRTDSGCVIVKRPNPVIYKRFRDRGEAKTVDLEKLVRACLVHPDGNGLDRILDDVPAALDRAANAIVELAGFRAKEVSGK
jgi:hypothetical protein